MKYWLVVYGVWAILMGNHFSSGPPQGSYPTAFFFIGTGVWALWRAYRLFKDHERELQQKDRHN